MTPIHRRHMLALLPGLLASPWGLAGSTYTIGIVPQFPLDQIYAIWTPLLAEVRRQGGPDLSIKPYATIPDFELGFRAGEMDFAYLNPYHAVMARRDAGYVPILRDDEERLTGILVVRADGPVDSVAALQGATIAFPAPNAFGASLYMRALLTEEHRLKFTPVYRSTHTNVLRHVISGRAQAGGAVRRTFEREPADVRAQLRVVYETPPAFPHPVAAHPRVPAAARKAFVDAMMRLAASPATAGLLSSVPMPRPIPAVAADYAPLARLGLERYVVLKEE